MTDAYTGRVVASIPLQKQIYTREIGVSANSFFGDTLVQLDAGGMEREAMHFALRQMLSLATFELLGQLMNQESYSVCRSKAEGSAGSIRSNGTADRIALDQAVKAMRGTVPPPPPMPLAVPVSKSNVEPSQPAAVAAPATPASSPKAPASLGPAQGQPPGISTAALAKGRQATTAATQAIRAARDSQAAPTRKIAVEKAAEALQLSNYALLLLREAAEMGFNGDEGEIAAVVIQQALKAAQEAGTAAAQRQSDVKTEAAKKAAEEADASKPIAEAPAAAASGDSTATPATPPASTVPPPPGGPVEDRRLIGGQ